MAYMRAHFFSRVLKQQTSLCVAYPENAAPPYPVLYLLHGGTEDSTLWFRETDVEALCRKFGLLAVSIDAMSSSYADMRHGGRYFTYLTEELPTLLRCRLPVSARREDSLIAGFSMGGQGALKAAFRRPEQYAACFALSGARDTVCLYEQWAKMENGPDLSGVVDALGPIDQIHGSDNDIVFLADEAAKSGIPLPALYLSCGSEDYAAPLSRAYHQHLEQIGLRHDYYEAGGPHGYDFAMRALDRALEAYFSGRAKR